MSSIVNETLKTVINTLENNGIQFANDVTVDNILNHFEDALDKEYKKEHGVVYTPEYIASGMFLHSLDVWIRNQSWNSDSLSLDDIINSNDVNLIKLFKDTICKIKILDPCVGSGVYPLEILKALADIQLSLDIKLGNETQQVEIYKNIIKNNLYMSDLDKNAALITSFRLWAFLSNAADIGCFEDFKPNLLVCDAINTCFNGVNIFPGFSLKHLSAQLQMGYSDTWKEALEKYRETKSIGSKCDLIEMGLEISAMIQSKKAPRYNKKIGERSKAKAFEIEFIEVFDTRGGFDIVVGNPPYISGNNIITDKDDLEMLYKEIYRGNADICLYFFKRSWDILNDTGVLSLITTNTWLTSEYATEFRGWLNSNTLKLDTLVDFGEFQIFDKAGVNTAITVLNKNKRDCTFKYVDGSREMIDY